MVWVFFLTCILAQAFRNPIHRVLVLIALVEYVPSDPKSFSLVSILRLNELTASLLPHCYPLFVCLACE